MTSFRTVAVIGAGPAGRAFALRCSRAGYGVVLEDVMPSNLRRAQDEYGEMSPAGAAGSLRFAATVEEAVRAADLAIDFVPDELESKLEIFSMVDRMAPPRTVLCTPTRCLSLTDLASCTYRPAQCVGLRGTGVDVLRGPVGLVRSRFTSADTLRLMMEFLVAMEIHAQPADDIEEPMLVSNLAR